MSQVRPAAVAGRFYSGNASALRKKVSELVDSVDVPGDDALARAYVVPHAGYVFSGPVAAHVYARLRRHADKIGRVVLVGPSHFSPLIGMAASPASGWETPLGTVRVADAGDVAAADPEPHAREHSLEVQLPFLQVCAGDGLTAVPVAVGKTRPDDVADALDRLVDSDTVLLCSTDLSHYLDDAAAKLRDRATADAILHRRHDKIAPGDACGIFALRGTVAWASRHGLRPVELDLRTSADTVGGPERVVGYPAFSFS
ncbi:MAG: AmmeMemoRadiSam system protein B [Stackebrandtia sp.]